MFLHGRSASEPRRLPVDDTAGWQPALLRKPAVVRIVVWRFSGVWCLEVEASLRLLARMKLPMNVPQAVAGDVGVNFRGADVRVAEQFLNHAQVRTMFQQMRGKTMS